MDLKNTMLSEIRQSKKDKYHMISLTYVKSNEQTELIGRLETDT